MAGSLKIGSIARIPIRVHWSFLLLIGYVWLATPDPSVSTLWPNLLWIVALFGFVTAHELSHCAMARRRGLEVQDILLLPIGGVSQIRALSGAGPKIERDVAIIGPLSNFAMAGVLAIVALLTGGHLWPPALLAGSWPARLAWLNVLLGAFNLLPALPMDGGRVMRALLAERGDPLRATRIASSVAIALGVLMMVAAFVIPGGDILLVFIGVLVIAGAVAERRTAVVRDAIANMQVGNVMAQDPTSVLAEVTVGQLAPWLASFPGRAVPIVDAEQYIGMIGMEDLLQAPPWTPVGEVADRSSPVLDANQSVYPDALAAFAATPRLQLAVTSGGRV
ncbi:MAG TPA: site-2 protease family protein, partial [Acidimicrobiales bacterium]|nr:site-2 protease family protein [Acidimicrobiales bacterium]